MKKQFLAVLSIMIFMQNFLLLAQNRNPAQDINRPNVWHFGFESVSGAKDAPSLHFDNGSPFVMNDGNPVHGRGSSSSCDSLGNLQLYSGHSKLHNRLHQDMENSGIVGDSGWVNISQKNLAIPKPNHPDIIYYFSASVTLRYNVIDMNLDSGQGAVIERNVLLHPYPVEAKLAAVHHCNGRDVWVVGHVWETDKFYAYLVTEAGIDTIPVISSVGPISNEQGAWQGGNIKFSPNGKKAAIAFGLFDTPPYVFDFDNSTGSISNPVALQKEINGGEWGLSFSPSNHLLYVSTLNNLILQYNLEAPDSTAIFMSRRVIYDAATHNTVRSFGVMQIGLDGKIYVVQNGFPGNDYLAVINDPNASDTLCNFELQGLYLQGSFGSGGHNTIESYFYTGSSAYPCYGDTTTAISLSPNDLQLNIAASPNPFSDYTLIQISDNKPIREKLSYRLTDVLGQQYKADISIARRDLHSVHFILHRRQLSPGYYFLTIQIADKIQTVKLSIL